MLKMKRNFAITAGILAIFSTLLFLFNLGIMFLSQYMYPPLSIGTQALILVIDAYCILSDILLCVCCFRRKLGTFPGIVMGLFSLYYLYTLVENIISLISGTTPAPLITVLLAICHLATAGLFALLLLTCFTGGRKKFSFVPVGFVAVTIVNALLLAVSNIPEGSGLSSTLVYLIIGLFAAAVSSIADLPYIFAAFAINGARPDHVPPYGIYPNPYQGPCYQQPQYQAPQYQAPQYQAPQYQAPQYQQPQYQAPQYQPPQAPQPQEQPQEQ